MSNLESYFSNETVLWIFQDFNIFNYHEIIFDIMNYLESLIKILKISYTVLFHDRSLICVTMKILFVIIVVL